MPFVGLDTFRRTTRVVRLARLVGQGVLSRYGRGLLWETLEYLLLERFLHPSSAATSDCGTALPNG